MPSFVLKINVITLALLLSACGGGGSSSSKSTDTPATPVDTFSISGTISPTVLIEVDSDVNDPNAAPNISNNTFATAQALQNFYTVNGFATQTQTNRVGKGDRFLFTTDIYDNYKVSLQAGQTIRLQVVNFEKISVTGDDFQGDLDLILFNTAGSEISRSESVTEFESITVPSTDEYYIQVMAFSGASKYVLNIGASSKQTTPRQTINFKTNEAIIKFKPTANSVSKNNMQIQLNSQSNDRPVLAHFSSIQAQTITTKNSLSQEEPLFLSELKALNPESYKRYITLNAIKTISLRDDVIYAEPNYIRTAKQVPNDPHYTKQWHYPAINLPQAWDLTTGVPSSGNVIVAVIDTGVFLTHEDLSGQLVAGYDFIADISNASDGNGIDNNPDDPGDGIQAGSSSWHGTHVAGTIAANTNNSKGIAGVSWGAKIMPLRVLGKEGGTTYDIAQAILFAAGLPNDSGTVPTNKADIINLSLGGGGFSQFSQDTYAQARDAGVIIIAAAGNENTSALSYPASYDGVISVSATDFNNDRAPYSNFGTSIDIAAPGGDSSRDRNNDGLEDGILSTLVDDSSGTRKPSYAFYQGTSMASPHIAGVMALMRAVYPELSPSEVDSLLAAGSLTSDLGAPGRDNTYGYGLVDALKAVNAAQTLANGGTAPPLPPLFLASPSNLSVVLNTTASFIISNVGGAIPAETSPAISLINNNEDWLSITQTSVDSNGLGTYTVNIDRTDLSDSLYADTIVFNIGNGKTLEIQITMIVGTNFSEGNLGIQYVLLYDLSTSTYIDQATANQSNNYRYQFNSVKQGTYQILAGSDIDNDLLICQLGESCGAYPVLSGVTSIEVSNQNISDLDFTAGLLFNFNESNSAGMAMIRNLVKKDISPPKKIIGVAH